MTREKGNELLSDYFCVESVEMFVIACYSFRQMKVEAFKLRRIEWVGEEKKSVPKVTICLSHKIDSQQSVAQSCENPLVSE